MSGDAGGPHARDSLEWRGRADAPAVLRLLARARARYQLREVLVPLAGARCPLYITLPADPDAPLDAMAARFKQAKALEATQASPDAALASGTTKSDNVLVQTPGAWPEPPPSPARGRLPHGPSPLGEGVGGEVCGARPFPTRPHEYALDAAESATRVLATGAHLPYWALLWPSGQALAEILLMHPERIAGRRILELGSGLGVTAATALALGANLWAADCFPDALLFAALNCLRCAGRRPHPLLLDWRTEAGRAACRALAPFDLVLAADVLYEAEDEAPLLDLIPTLLHERGAFWLAEPGRRVSREFVVRALAAGWRDEVVEVAHPWPLEREVVRVGVHRFTLPGRAGVH